MSKLTFFTPTILDEAFIFTMGASIKKTDNPIGYVVLVARLTSISQASVTVSTRRPNLCVDQM